MLSNGTIRVLIAGALFVHGVALVVAIVALVRQAAGAAASSWPTMRSRLLPSLTPRSAAAIAIPFWAVSGIGFMIAAMSFWGTAVPDGAWRKLAVGAAIVSLVRILIFTGIWPGALSGGRSVLDTSIAVAFNLIVLVALLLLHWPSASMFGR